MPDEPLPITVRLLGWQAQILATDMTEEVRGHFARLETLIEDGIQRARRIEAVNADFSARLEELQALRVSGKMTDEHRAEAREIARACDGNKAVMENLFVPIQTEWNRLQGLV